MSLLVNQLGEALAAMKERAERAEAQVQAVRALCQSARVSISKGCLCYGDECSGTCGRGKPMGWNLNPDDILRALDRNVIGGGDNEAT